MQVFEARADRESTNGERVTASAIRVLVVEDYEPFRRFLLSTLQNRSGIEVLGEVSDGLEAVQKAQELQPDLILLDIGLPSLNGVEAARRIRQTCVNCSILFISENRSLDIVEAALSAGARGYVVKSDAGSELLPAVKTVLQGKQFVSASLRNQNSGVPPTPDAAIAHCHEVAFFTDDSSLVDDYARFIKSALKAGNAVIVVVNESHRTNLLPKLEADGVDVPAAIVEGGYIPLDATDAVSRLTVNGMPDPVLCAKELGDLINEAAKGVKREHGRVVACGEIAPTLLSNGNAEGAIKLERLWDEITRGYGVHTLCGYLSNAFAGEESSPVLEAICAAHSAVYSH